MPLVISGSLNDDLTNPTLSERVAQYVGALRLFEAGNVGNDFVTEKLRSLMHGCRAADRALAIALVPVGKRIRDLLEPTQN